MSDKPLRASILSRRKRFLAIALTGVATGSIGACSESSVCLSMMPPPDAGDAGDADADDANDADGQMAKDAPDEMG